MTSIGIAGYGFFKNGAQYQRRFDRQRIVVVRHPALPRGTDLKEKLGLVVGPFRKSRSGRTKPGSAE